MRIGWCTAIGNIGLVEALGFDYIECDAEAVAAMNGDDFSDALRRVEASSLRAEAFCGMFSDGLRLTGDDCISLDRLDEYVARLYERLARLGGKVAVFGSGQARSAPAGFDHGRAFEQLTRCGRIMAARAAENGLVIALEPLNPAESNLINDSVKGAELVSAVASPAFRMLLDYYHMYKSGEKVENAGRLGNSLVHIHIAHPLTRKNPLPNDGGGYDGFFAALRSGGYDGRVTFEGFVDDPVSELPATLVYLRSLAE